MIYYLFWDFDGTLWDTYPAINLAFQQAAADLDVDLSLETIQALTGISMFHCLSTISFQYNVDQQQLKSKYREKYNHLSLNFQKPFEGTKQLCTAFVKHGGQHFIITHRNPESTEALLTAYQLKSQFTDWVAPHLGFERKPHPEMVNYILDKYNLDPNQCLMVGDRDLDLEAAYQAGVRTCAFGFGKFSFTPNFSVKTMPELKKLIWQNNNWD